MCLTIPKHSLLSVSQCLDRHHHHVVASYIKLLGKYQYL